MKYNSKEYNTILKQFQKGRDILNDIEIEIKGGENNISPLILLRAYDEEPTVDNLLALSSQFVLNKQVVFTRKDEVLLDFVYNGGDLSEKFAPAPYLMDMLLKLSYSILLKKLTPPSAGSENGEQR
jgi:hypothetical protein